MTDDQLFNSLKESSLFNTYLLYSIIGLLVFVTIIGLFIFFIITCCSFCSISSCFCCNYRHRYKLDEIFKKQENIKNYSSDITNFSQLYDSKPHLINNKAMITKEKNKQNLDSNSTSIHTLVSPISSCSSFCSFIESVPSIQNNLKNSSPLNIDNTNISTKNIGSRPFAYIKNPNDRTKILRRFISNDCSNSPTIKSVDRIEIPLSDNDINTNQINSPSTNIYETVIPITNINSSLDQSTPIYEIEWTNHLKQLMTNQTLSIDKNPISIIELPSTSDINSTIHYFQQQQHPYDKFLENRTNTSDSMRRANMLQQLKDDTAFLY